MLRLRIVAGSIVAVVFASGCGGDCDPPSDAAVFEVGTGEECFERFEDPPVVTVNEGPQGGYHVWLAIGCADCGTSIHFRYRAVDSATGEEAVPLTEWIEPLVGEAWPQVAGIQMGLPGGLDDDRGPLPEGTALDVTVEALSANGGEVLHSQSLSIVLGPRQIWNP